MTNSLIGRHHELGVLVDTIKGARTGAFATVLIRGEAGIGKTRLLVEAMEQAKLLGHRVLYGRVDGLDRDVPFVALRAALEEALRLEDDPALLPAVENLWHGLWLAPFATGRPLRNVFASAEQLLRTWGRRQPVLLAVDDLHAADRDTLTVLSLLIRHLGGARVTMIGTIRPDPPDLPLSVGAVLDGLVADGMLMAVDLPNLDAAEVRMLAASLLGGAPADPLAERLFEATAGNPFYVTEAITFLEASGALHADEDGRHTVDLDVAPRLTARSALLHRIFQLGPEARGVARALSIFPHVSLDRIDLVAEVCGLTSAEVDAAFDDLVAARVLTETAAGHGFAHPIVRDTLYHDLGPAERRRTHAAVASRLVAERSAGRSVEVVELAVHVAASASRGDAAAAAILAEAGSISMQSAPASAAGWFDRAADLVPAEDAAQQDLYRAAQVRALFLVSRFEEAAAIAARIVPRLPVGQLRGRTVALLISSLSALGRFDDALRVADAALASSPAPMPRVRTERGTIFTYLDRFDEAEADGRAALAAAGTDQAAAAAAYGQLAATAHAVGDVETCLSRLDDQFAMAQDLWPGARLSCLATRVSYLAFLGSLGRAEETLVEADVLCEELGGASFRGVLDSAATIVDWLAGRWDGVLERVRWADIHPDVTPQQSRSLARCAEVAVCADRGLYSRAKRAAKDLNTSTSLAVWARGILHAALGELDVAEELLRERHLHDRTVGRRSSSGLLLAALVDVELGRGRKDVARRWAEELAESAGSMGSPLEVVLAGRALAVATGEVDAAIRGLVVAEAEGLVVEEARLRMVIGAFGVEPAVHLPAALATFVSIGSEGDRLRTVAAMRAAGIEHRRGRRGEPGELTAAEIRLALLVHEGLTNRQIANVLHLSRKTVEVYLSRVFVKTGCSSRLELALAISEGRIGAHLE